MTELRSVLDGELASTRSPTVASWRPKRSASSASESDLDASLDLLIDYADIEQHGVYVAQAALIALDELDARRRPAARPHRHALPRTAPGIHDGCNPTSRLIEKTLADVDAAK